MQFDNYVHFLFQREIRTELHSQSWYNNDSEMKVQDRKDESENYI